MIQRHKLLCVNTIFEGSGGSVATTTNCNPTDDTISVEDDDMPLSDCSPITRYVIYSVFYLYLVNIN